MGARKLVAELARAPHDERMRRMVAVGRDARSKPAAKEAISELTRGPFFERMLALQSVYGSGDGGLAARAALDRSAIIRGRSLRLVALFAEDAAIAAVFKDLRRSLRLPLLRHLRRRRRFGPVDACLEWLVACGDRELARVLPLGSAECVWRHAQQAFERGTPGQWGRLARFHPTTAVSLLVRRAESPGSDEHWFRPVASAVIAALSTCQPDAALRLARLASDRCSAGLLPLRGLARSRPNEVAALILATEDEICAWSNWPRPDRLDEERLLVLLSRRPGLLPQPDRWLRHLPPVKRVDALDAAGSNWRDPTGAVSPAVLGLLPSERRIAEARRHVQLPSLAATPALRLPYMALLPWEEACGGTTAYIGHPDPALRSAALFALIGSVRYERGRLADVLALLQGRKNEQDPVRLAMLTALAGLPVPAFESGLLDATAAVLRQALDAPDFSAATGAAAQRLLVRLLPRHPRWASGWFEVLARERVAVAFSDLESRCNDAQAAALAEALGPLLRAWSTRERDGALLALAQGLGARLRTFEVLHPHLERIARESRGCWSPAALALLARHASRRFAALVPRLLRDDHSWGVQPQVYAFLHRRRQELLGPYLGRKAWAGRFSTGKTRFVLPLVSGFQRWCPAQQETFAKTLREVADPADRERDSWTVLLAVRQLAAMPAADHGCLIRLGGDGSRPAVRDGSLRALASLDDGAGVATLVDALSDERARVAAYALRPAVLDMPPSEAVALLRKAPFGKLTVAKEVLRLVGDLRGDESFALLRALAAEAATTAESARRPVHRDLRVALLRAYWGHLDRAEAWEEIDRAATDSDPALVSGVIRMPSDRMSPKERERFAAVVTRLLGHPDPSVRCRVLTRLAGDPLPDSQGTVLGSALPRLQSSIPDEVTAAARAVTQLGNSSTAQRIASAIASMTKDRRAQRAFLDALTSCLRFDRARLVPVARAALVSLAPDSLADAHRVVLAITALSGEEQATAVRAFAQQNRLTADVLQAGMAALGALAAGPSATQVECLLTAFDQDSDEGLRRLALAALVELGESRHGAGWTPQRLARLRAFRQDPAALVAAAAQFTLPLAELESAPQL